MPLNRLKLNWQLDTRKARLDFVNEYIKTLKFKDYLTEHELETLSNYILWGKNQEGLNGRQEGLELETRFKTWDSQEDESLDALLESPNFSENNIHSTTDTVYTTPKVKLDRNKERKNAPEYILRALENLWEQIDKYELIISFYDLAHNKRKAEIRQSLLNKFGEEELNQLKEKAESIKNYTYLKMRHELVELRKEQYIFRDMYYEKPFMNSIQNKYYMPNEHFEIKDLIKVRPMGLPGDSILGSKVFREDRFPEPQDFNEEELKILSDMIWKDEKEDGKKILDFGDVENLYKIVGLLESGFEEELGDNEGFKEIRKLFDVYSGLAQLKSHYRRVLELKLKHKTNQEISDKLFEEFGHRYTLNYISTMYCKSIIPEIARTAKFHRMVCENLFFKENFKTCIDCGKTLLRVNENFMKKAKVKDGYSPRCKSCEKIKRNLKKGE